MSIYKTLRKSKLLDLQNIYKTDSAIGKILGVTRQAIHQHRKKHNIPPIDNPNLERDEEIYKMYTNQTSGTKIAKVFSLSISTTYKIIKAQSKLESKPIEDQEKPVKEIPKNPLEKSLDQFNKD